MSMSSTPRLLKRYDVHMYNQVPSSTDKCHGRFQLYEEKEKALACARSERRNWDRVTVFDTETRQEIALFDGDNLYVDGQVTRLDQEM